MTAAAASLGTFDDIITGPSGIEFKEVKAWGKTYGLLSITAGEVLEWLEDKANPDRSKEAALRLLARSFVDDDRKRLCSTPEQEERLVVVLRDKDSKTVNVLVNEVLILNGITTQTAETVKKD